MIVEDVVNLLSESDVVLGNVFDVLVVAVLGSCSKTLVMRAFVLDDR